MGKYIAVFLLISLLAACSDAQEPETVEDQEAVEELSGLEVIRQTAELPFPKGRGTVKLEFKEEAINFIVEAEELSPELDYLIKIIKGKDGVTFGPEENVEIKAGEAVGETIFKPDKDGRLFISMENPDRIMEGSEGVAIAIQAMDGEALVEMFQTEQFLIERK